MNKTLLRVATFMYKPYQWFNDVGIGVQVNGFYGNVLKALGSSLQFEFEIIDTGAWGTRLPNGTWTGAFGAIQKEEADITLCPTNPSAEHLPLAVQSPGLHPTEIVILAGRLSRFQSNAFGLIMTFPPSVWTALACGVVLVGLLMAFIHWILLQDNSFVGLAGKYAFTLVGNIWQEVTAPPFNSLRIVWMTWYLGVSLILMCAFAGQMKASMMFKPEKERIDSLRNLYQQYKLKMYVPKDSIVDAQLKNHAEAWGRSLYYRIVRQGTAGNATLIFHSDVLRDIVQSRSVIIASRIAIAKAADPYCSVMPAGEFYVAHHSMYSFRGVIHLSRITLDERTRKDILYRLTWLSETGVLSKWVADMAGAWEGCSARAHIEKHEAVELQELEGLFYIVLIFAASSVVSLAGEKIVSRVRSRASGQQPLDTPIM